jgi:hypothetical protein
MLRDEACPEDVRVENAAAALAFYRLVLRRTAENPETLFKAGDVSVSRKPGDLLAAAEKIRDEAFAAAAPLLKDDRFLFTGV